MTLYILEAQKFHPRGHLEHPEWDGKYEHIGYVNHIFTTKKAACEHYDKHNPEMRSLNAHGTWRSDWHPHTYLRYVVREYSGEWFVLPDFV